MEVAAARFEILETPGTSLLGNDITGTGVT